MDFPHMSIYPLSTRERLHTLPTDVRLTPRARHMVAPLRPLDRHITCWTVLHIVLLHPLLEQFILHLICTLESIVRLRMTPRTDAREA